MHHKHARTHSQTLTTEARKVAESRSVLILGGGTVGVELAAEIAWRYRTGDGGKQVGIRSGLFQMSYRQCMIISCHDYT